MDFLKLGLNSDLIAGDVGICNMSMTVGQIMKDDRTRAAPAKAPRAQPPSAQSPLSRVVPAVFMRVFELVSCLI